MPRWHMRGITDTLGPCPPQLFSGRENDRETILEYISGARDHGEIVLIPGIGGLGKSSLLARVAYELRSPGATSAAGSRSLVIEKGFSETIGTTFATYVQIIRDLQAMTLSGRFEAILADEGVKRAISLLFDLLNSAVSTVAPKPVSSLFGVITDRVEDRIGAGALSSDSHYDLVRTAFVDVLKKISGKLHDDESQDRRLVLLLDDVQLTTGPDWVLLKDLVRELYDLPCIVFLIAYERRTADRHRELEEIIRRFYREKRIVELDRLESAEIVEFARLRYNTAIDTEVANYLKDNLGEPFVLVSCFNQLLKRGLTPDREGFARIIDAGGLENPGRACFLGNEDQRDHANRLCILSSPFPLDVAGTLEETPPLKLWDLKDALSSSPIFEPVADEHYDFVAPWIKEYCRRDLPRRQAVAQHGLAARGFEARLKDLQETLDDPRDRERMLRRKSEKDRAELLLESHYYEAREYGSALDLALRIFDRYLWTSNFRTANSLAEHAIRCADKLGRRDALADAFIKKGDLLRLMNDTAGAYDCYRTSWEIYRELPDGWLGVARSRSGMGAICGGNGKHAEALEMYRESLVLYRAHHDRENEAYVLDEIGHVHERQYDYGRALDTHLKSLAIKKQIPNLYGTACTLLNIGVVQQYLGTRNNDMEKFDLAREYYRQSWMMCNQIADQLGDESRAGAALSEQVADLRAKIRLECGIACRPRDAPGALVLLADSLARYRESGNRRGEASAYREMGTTHCLLHRFDDARECFVSSLGIFLETGDRHGVESTNLEMERWKADLVAA